MWRGNSSPSPRGPRSARVGVRAHRVPVVLTHCRRRCTRAGPGGAGERPTNISPSHPLTALLEVRRGTAPPKKRQASRSTRTHTHTRGLTQGTLGKDAAIVVIACAPAGEVRPHPRCLLLQRHYHHCHCRPASRPLHAHAGLPGGERGGAAVGGTRARRRRQSPPRRAAPGAAAHQPCAAPPPAPRWRQAVPAAGVLQGVIDLRGEADMLLRALRCA